MAVLNTANLMYMQYLKDVISQFKESDARWKKAQDELRKAAEGKE